MNTLDDKPPGDETPPAGQRRWAFSLEEAEAHFRVIADAAPVLIWRLLDQTGTSPPTDFPLKARS